MVDYLGRWTPEEDYCNYPKDKWCDFDYVANYIKEQNYIPRTSMNNLAYMLIAHFEGEVESGESCFSPAYGENSMINIENLSAFVEASGGLKEFDYEC